MRTKKYNRYGICLMKYFNRRRAKAYCTLPINDLTHQQVMHMHRIYQYPLVIYWSRMHWNRAHNEVWTQCTTRSDGQRSTNAPRIFAIFAMNRCAVAFVPSEINLICHWEGKEKKKLMFGQVSHTCVIPFSVACSSWSWTIESVSLRVPAAVPAPNDPKIVRYLWHNMAYRQRCENNRSTFQ